MMSPRRSRLEDESDARRWEIEDAIADREAAKNQVRAISEEVSWISEEPETSNEQLETPIPELISLNEKLTAINAQLEESLNQQTAAANDLENILDSSDVATIFLDEKLNIRFFTPAARALFSVIASDVGRPLADLAHHFANPTLLSDARAVLASLAPVTREVAADDGTWFNCRILPYRTKDNRIEGVVITFADVTARKRAEELANAARLQAENANLGKSRFLAAASHDLRQPLQTLGLLQGLLAKKLKDEDALRLLARSDEALKTMSGILNTLLDIHQLEAGAIRPEIADFPINDLLEALKTEFDYHAKAKRLDWRVVPCRLLVRSDPRLLDQMLRNLLSNAVKYTRKGGLILGCRRRADKLRIEVHDTGLGIPEGQQLDAPARGLSRNLGLAIVPRLADLLGLTIDVRSRENGGSVFAIDVPLAPRGARPSPTAAEVEPDHLVPGECAILIVEDDPALRESLELFLSEEGYLTTSVADGEEAAQQVEQLGLRPDLVIVDLSLSRALTGLGVVTRLRATLADNVPALLLTGDASTQTLRKIAAQGDEHRTKPVATGDLSRLVRRLLVPKSVEHLPRSAMPARGSPPGAHIVVHHPPAGSRDTVIFLIDDDHAVRAAMGEVLRSGGRMVDSYASAEDFLAAYRPGDRGVLLVDAVMPGIGGLALLDRLKVEGHDLPAIMITGNGDIQTAIRALQAGAIDFIEKPVGEKQLLASIGRALEQTRSSSQRVISRAAAAARLAGLTPRQRLVLELVIAGQPSKIIAADLGISQRTVESHRAAIMHTTRSKSFAELVRVSLAAN